jgi:hypothetical protein
VADRTSLIGPTFLHEHTSELHVSKVDSDPSTKYGRTLQGFLTHIPGYLEEVLTWTPYVQAGAA